MVWPVGVTLRDVNFSAAIGTEDGASYPARAIVRTNQIVIFLGTGVPLLPVGEIFTGNFQLPVTDETLTYGDGYGSVYDTSNGGHTHTYHIDIEYQINGVWKSGRRLENVVVPSSDLAFDLDLTVGEGFVSSPIKVLIPDVWSPGAPGSFTIQDLEAVGIFFPESYGAQGYPNDDVPAWNACQDAVVARGGGTVWASQQYGGSGVAYHRGGVTVRGMGNPRVEIPDFEGEVGFKALDDTFQYLYGMYVSPDGHSRDNNPGPLENFYIDGDFLSDREDGLVRAECANSSWFNVSVRRAKGNGLVLPSTQNMVFFNCQVGEINEPNTVAVQYTTVTNIIDDVPIPGQGVGGCKWYGFHIGDSWLPFQSTASMVGVILPNHDNIFDGGLFETGRTDGLGIKCNVELLSGETLFHHVVFTIGAKVASIAESCNLLIDNTINSGYSTIAVLNECWMGGGSDTDTDGVGPDVAVYATDNIKVRQSGAFNEIRVNGIQAANSDYFICVDGINLGSADLIGDISGYFRIIAGGAALGKFRGINGGTYAGLVGSRYTPLRFVNPAIKAPLPNAGEADITSLGNVIQVRVEGKAANSYQVDGKGTTRWPNPNTGAVFANQTPDYVNSVMAFQGRWFFQDGIGKSAGFQILGVSAAVTIDVAANPAFIISFTGNGVSATSVTLTNMLYGVSSAFTEGAEVTICLLSSVNYALINWDAGTPITWLRSTGGPQPVLNKAVYLVLRYEGGSWREKHGKPQIDQFAENRPTTGMEVFPRTIAVTPTVASPTGTLNLTYFKAYKSFNSTSVRMFTTNTAAAASPTLVRIGLYSVAANGDLTLIAATPNDTTLFAAANTVYTKNWSVPVDIVEGQRYAVGPLIVTAVAAPTLACNIPVTAVTDEDPRLCGRISALADLPASSLAAGVSIINIRFYAILR